MEGDWNIARGAYFAGALDEKVHLLPTHWPHRVDKFWRPFFAMDWGTAAPSVCYLCLRAPDANGPFPKDSLILLDELAAVYPNDPNRGLGWPPAKLAEAIHEMASRWGVRSVLGVGDDSYGLEDTLLNVLRDHEIYLTRPKKERIAGWAKMR